MNANDKQVAYDHCSQAMLLNPEYIPSEGHNATYILVKIVDQPKTIAIHSMIVNPVLPESGSIKTFGKIPMDQKLAVLSLKGINALITKNHRQLEHIGKLVAGRDPDDIKEAKKLVQRMFMECIHTPSRH